MNTLILAETRKMGVDWLAQNVANDAPGVHNRNQTEIVFTNGDKMVVISKGDHLGLLTPLNGDRGIIVGTVSDDLIDRTLARYKAYKVTIELTQGLGQVLTATEIKRRKLIQQMADLDKEERINAFFKDIRLEGTKITKTTIHSDTNNRSFSIQIDGKYV